MKITIEQRLRLVLASCVEREVLSTELAQVIQDMMWAPMAWEMWDVDRADRVVGPVGSGKIFGGLAGQPLNEGLSFGLRCARRDEAEEAFDASIGRGLGAGDAEEATAATGHVSLSGEDTENIASGKDVLGDGSKEEGDGIVVEVADKALLGRWVPCEGLTCFLGETETGAAGVEDVVDEGNPLRGFDPYSRPGAVDGSGGGGV